MNDDVKLNPVNEIHPSQLPRSCYEPGSIKSKPLNCNIYIAEKGTFEWALIQMKNGKKLARKNWNGKGQYVFISRHEEFGDPLEDHFRICTSQQKVNTWVPSVSDLLADDWTI